MKLSERDFNFARWEEAGVAIPYGLKPAGAPGGRVNVIADEAAWDAYQWNPPESWVHKYPEPDPNASPKPSWNTVIEAIRRGRIWSSGETAYEALNYGLGEFSPDEIRRQMTDADALSVGRLSVYVGAGLDHMTGLLQMVEQAAQAGARLPHIVMRDGDQKRRHIHTQGEIRAILDATAERENVVESAHNSVLDRYHAQARIRDDEAQALDDREAAAAKALDIAQDYKTHLETEMAAYDPDALPTDLPTLKAVLAERLEAAAMARTKYVMKAATQQGIDRGFSCADEERAVREIAEQCVLASIEVERADTAAEAKTAYDAGGAAIEAVTVLNTPVWKIGGADYAANPPAPVAVAGSAVTVEALHPAGQTIKGKVALKSLASKPVTVTPATPSVASAHACKFTIDAPVTGETVTLFLEARNLCGPSKVEVELTP